MRSLWLMLFVAAGCAPRPIPSFGELDSDGDGRLVPEEAEQSPELIEVFGEVDVDRDGELTVGEYLAAVSRL